MIFMLDQGIPLGIGRFSCVDQGSSTFPVAHMNGQLLLALLPLVISASRFQKIEPERTNSVTAENSAEPRTAVPSIPDDSDYEEEVFRFLLRGLPVLQPIETRTDKAVTVEDIRDEMNSSEVAVKAVYTGALPTFEDIVEAMSSSQDLKKDTSAPLEGIPEEVDGPFDTENTFLDSCNLIEFMLACREFEEDDFEPLLEGNPEAVSGLFAPENMHDLIDFSKKPLAPLPEGDQPHEKLCPCEIREIELAFARMKVEEMNGNMNPTREQLEERNKHLQTLFGGTFKFMD